MPNWKQDLPGEAPPVKDAELTHWMESGLVQYSPGRTEVPR